MTITSSDYRRFGVSAVAGVALAYHWRGHGALRTFGAFLLGSFVAHHAMNIAFPPPTSTITVGASSVPPAP